MKIKKYVAIFMFVFCSLVIFYSNVNAQTWTLVDTVKMPTGFRFQYGNYSGQNYLYTDKFILNSDTGEQRTTYCIQHRILTVEGVKYDLTVYDLNTAMAENISSLANQNLEAYASGDGNNTAQNYWLNVLGDKVKQSFNVAYIKALFAAYSL